MGGRSELGLDPSLLADFVGGNPIELFVALDGNYFGTIGVDGVVSAFSQQIEMILLQMSDEITSLDRHVESLWAVALSVRYQGEFPCQFAGKRAPFRLGHRGAWHGTLQGPCLR